ncbi:MAG: OmpA family protein [Acidobacteriaceae bacterium]|nr:OmpA family protein [Acidobacteriaceae bacterium]
MKHIAARYTRTGIAFVAQGLLAATLVLAVEPNTRTFSAGDQVKVQGVIISRTGDVLKLRGDDEAIGTIDLTGETKIQMKRSFGRKTAMQVDALVPGLHIEAQGKGNEKGELLAEKVTFDPNSMRASRQIDTRVHPLEERTGSLEGRAGQLENRAGQMETRQGQLEGQEKQTEQQVGQVKTEADQANQGVTDVNGRVSNLDNYKEELTKTIYFRLNSTALSADDKKELDDLAQKALSEKAYVIEVAGYADTTGKAAKNQLLSDRRANVVIQYLEQNSNVEPRRILTPAAMGTSHPAADNKTPEGRKENRRVEVKVLVNQGVVAGSNASSSTASKQPGESNQQ